MKKAKFNSVLCKLLGLNGKRTPPCKTFINLIYARCPVLYVRREDGCNAASYRSITVSANSETPCWRPKCRTEYVTYDDSSVYRVFFFFSNSKYRSETFITIKSTIFKVEMLPRLSTTHTFSWFFFYLHFCSLI